RGDTSILSYFAFVRKNLAAQHSQKRGLARAIEADDAQRIASLKAKTDIFQCPELAAFQRPDFCSATPQDNVPKQAGGPTPRVCDRAGVHLPDPVDLKKGVGTAQHQLMPRTRYS